MQNRRMTFAPPKVLYYCIFTVSGFSGLIYESIWSHYLKLFLGHAAYAQALVLSIFMGGMALGAWLAGRYSPRWRTPILMYAVVEAAIGVFALIFHNGFISLTELAYTSILPAAGSVALAHALKWSLAALMIIPQSILLGMTFPLMTAGIIRRYSERSGGTISLLYFTNSIGAAAGVLASGFWLIEAVGLPVTIATAGLINILLALIVACIVRLDRSPAAIPTPVKKSAGAKTASTLWLTAAFITGMASFIYEIGWIRMLSLVLGSSTHAFELMLSAFITGLAFGGLWIRNRIDSLASPLRFAAYVQLAMGLLALLTLLLYGLSFDWMSSLMWALARTEEGYRLLLFGSHAIVLIIMLPVTFCAGITLPLFTHALLTSGYGEKSIGQIYAFNTCGSIAGVLFAVNMLPFLGLEYLITVGAALDMTLGIALLYFVARKQRSLPALALSACAVALGLMLLSLTDIRNEQLASGVFRYQETELPADKPLYYYRDGKTASISLYGKKDQALTIATNGKPDASISMQGNPSGDESTTILLGILPFGYKPDAGTIAVIGLGSGMTTHSVLALPQVSRVDTIEIEPAIVEASRHFGYKTERAHTDPRSNIHIEDAKTFFSLNNTRYDIIISEPSNPWVSGVSSLYTTEFYGHIKRSLQNDGILVQWIHLYENDLALVFSILNAIDANFSDYALYFTNDADILIVSRNNGELGPLDTDFLFAAGLEQELHNIHIKTVADLHYRLIAGKRHLSALLRESGVPVNSDYFPYLDLHAHEAFFINEPISEFYPDADAFPVVDMLAENRQPAIPKELTETTSLKLSIIHTTARLAARELSGAGPENSGQLAYDIRNALLALRSTAARCDRAPYDTQFLQNLHQLARLLIVGLDRESASAALRSGAFAACSRIATPEPASWIAFYQAVAERDFAQVIRSAEKLFMANDFINDKPLLAYLLTATLVAYHHAGTPEEAWLLWGAYGETFEYAGEMPFYLKLAVSNIPEQ